MSDSVDAARNTAIPRRVYLTRVFRFNAGHRLYRPERDASWNREVFGKCSYEGGHGHNYTLALTVSGFPCPRTGFIVDLCALDRVFRERVMEWIDHRNLNDALELEIAPVPTTEVLVVEIWNRLVGEIPRLGRAIGRAANEKPIDTGARLHRLSVYETSKNVFEYAGP